MGSSDIVSSGRVRSNFSSTCNRLSRYLKEKGGSNLGDIGLAFTPQRNYETKGTMNLLSMIDDNSRHNEKSDKSVINHEAAKNAQMTIFFGGRILVFDDLPASKAREILMFAGAPADNSLLRPPLDSDLPIARKKSLSRFLEKRKERAAANAPYPPPLVKAAEEGSWLGLAPKLSLQI